MTAGAQSASEIQNAGECLPTANEEGILTGGSLLAWPAPLIPLTPAKILALI